MAVVVAVAATVFTCGAAGVVLGAVGAAVAGSAAAATAAATVATTAVAAGLSALGTSALVAGTVIVGATTAATALAYGAAEAVDKAIARKRNKVTYNGRDTVVPKGF